MATLDFSPLANALKQLRDGITQADLHAEDELQRDGAIILLSRLEQTNP